MQIVPDRLNVVVFFFKHLDQIAIPFIDLCDYLHIGDEIHHAVGRKDDIDKTDAAVFVHVTQALVEIVSLFFDFFLLCVEFFLVGSDFRLQIGYVRADSIDI